MCTTDLTVLLSLSKNVRIRLTRRTTRRRSFANGEWQNRNEIKVYLKGRYVFAFETSWRLFSFKMHDETSSVTCLAVHKLGMHMVV
jgi:hypothetical protein